MFDWMSKEKGLIFAGGAVVGAVALQFLKSRKARNCAVQGLARGMMLKDCAMETVANIREEAEDIGAEARELAAEDCDCGCACACTPAETDAAE